MKLMTAPDILRKQFDVSERTKTVAQGHGLWVFGYGSLMWNPGFPYSARYIGRCAGLHRSLCVWSVYHRGTSQSPGLVLGLNSGGVCEGTLFHVSAGDAAATIGYLRRREQVTKVYREVYRRVELLDGSGRFVQALCYVVNRDHPQFSGKISLARQAHIVRGARGLSGHNLDYLSSTVHHLRDLELKDDLLRRILVLTQCAHRLG